MTDHGSDISRRFFLGGVTLGALTLAAGSALAQPLPVRDITVSGRGNRDIARLAPMVQRNLAEQLGGRYAPGARGGVSLGVELTIVSLPTDTDAGFGGFSPGYQDTLNARITVRKGRTVVSQFPFRASTGSSDASAMYPDATDFRLERLARAYSYWLVRQID